VVGAPALKGYSRRDSHWGCDHRVERLRRFINGLIIAGFQMMPFIVMPSAPNGHDDRLNQK